jgi:hypothetical protein
MTVSFIGGGNLSTGENHNLSQVTDKLYQNQQINKDQG